MIDIDKALGLKITQAIEDNNITRVDFADFLGVQVTTLSRWEKGTISIKVRYLPAICKILKIPMSDLLEGKYEYCKKPQIKRRNQNLTFDERFKLVKGFCEDATISKEYSHLNRLIISTGFRKVCSNNFDKKAFKKSTTDYKDLNSTRKIKLIIMETKKLKGLNASTKVSIEDMLYLIEK